MAQLQTYVFVLLLVPRVVRAPTAPAGTSTTASPLLSLNVPNPLNSLGMTLENIGSSLTGGWGLGHMLGHYNYHTNEFHNQIVVYGLLGMATFKMLGFFMVLAVLVIGGLMVKMVGMAVLLSTVKTTHYVPLAYHRSYHASPRQYERPWKSKVLETNKLLIWERR